MIYTRSKDTINNKDFGHLKVHKDSIAHYVVFKYDKNGEKLTYTSVYKNAHRFLSDKIELDCITPRGIKHSFSFDRYNFCDICVYNILRYAQECSSWNKMDEPILEHDTHKIRVAMRNGFVIRADTSCVSELWRALEVIGDGLIEISNNE